MKLESAIMGMFISEDGTRIEIKDKTAAITFAVIKLTPEQLSCLLSRRADTPCEIELFGLERIGKKMENEIFEFKIGVLTYDNRNKELVTVRCENSLKNCGKWDEGWRPDVSFNYQNSFFQKGDDFFARTTIRRWI